MSARLHVLLGAGGVGKTTLAAGYAFALARAGGRVGLLGIDPSHRLQAPLGLPLNDLEVLVPDSGQLRAAILRPEQSMRRWAADACPDPLVRARLLANVFFVALADRLATATDLLAAARVAEWAERDPDMTDLVVDTAPGLNAIEFLGRPRSLAAFLEGPLVRWLRRLAPNQTHGAFSQLLRGGARRVVGGLDKIGGTHLLSELADFLALVEGLVGRMLDRVTVAQGWFNDPRTELLLVAAVRDDAAQTAQELARALASLHLAPRATVVNRALPTALGPELDRLEDASLPPEAVPFVRYARAYTRTQARVIAAVGPLAPTVVVVPASRGLDEEGRREALTALGEHLRFALR